MNSLLNKKIRNNVNKDTNNNSNKQPNNTIKREIDLISVIIPSYNRHKYLLNAVRSVNSQTYKNVEIIIVNDCSTQEEYYSFDYTTLGNNVFIVHLPKNSRKIFGKVCGGGNARNIGIMIASGKYIAFLDDDDSFLPNKLERQLEAMKKHNCGISCTEALCGSGPYKEENTLKYKNWHYKGIYWNALNNIFRRNNKMEMLEKMYENETNIWGLEEINTHNCTCGGSSIIVRKDIVDKSGYFPVQDWAEDWDYWKKLFANSKCVFIREPMIYIDKTHGDGQNY